MTRLNRLLILCALWALCYSTNQSQADWRVMSGAPHNSNIRNHHTEPTDPDAHAYIFWNETTVAFEVGAYTEDVELLLLTGEVQDALDEWDAIDSSLWEGKDFRNQPLASGVYVVKLIQGAKVQSSKVTLLR